MRICANAISSEVIGLNAPSRPRTSGRPLIRLRAYTAATAYQNDASATAPMPRIAIVASVPGSGRVTLGIAISTTPPNPTSTPTSLFSVIGSSSRTSAARTTAYSGTSALRTPAIPDGMNCCPHVMSENGKAIWRSARIPSRLHASRVAGSPPRTARRTRPRNSAPARVRMLTIVNSGTPSSIPIRMKRNELLQMAARLRNAAQSTVSRRVAGARGVGRGSARGHSNTVSRC